MGDVTKIAWCDSTFNPWIGCQKVSPACDNCYAEAMMDLRYGRVQWGPNGTRVRTSEGYWKRPLRWNREAVELGKRKRVFCASLADVFDNKVPKAWRTDLFDIIRKTPELDWLLLTKRPQNIAKMLPPDWLDDHGEPWPNVWLGTSCETTEYLDKRYKHLAAVPAVIRFISYEPALGPLRIGNAARRRNKPDWIICGGETRQGGNEAREMSEVWARDLRDDCARYDIAFFVKQMTDKRPIPDDLMVRQYPKSAA